MNDDNRSDLDHELAAMRTAREPEDLAAQKSAVPGYDFTTRDLANALVAMTFRNGFLEELHAGKDSPLLADPSLSRITNAEMKRLMIESSAQLAIVLHQLFDDADAFHKWYGRARQYTRGWEREALR
jgi:hypothetical protein